MTKKETPHRPVKECNDIVRGAVKVEFLGHTET